LYAGRHGCLGCAYECHAKCGANVPRRHALTLLAQQQQQRGEPADGLELGELSFAEFLQVYARVVHEGKFWSVEHDVMKLGVWFDEDAPAGEECPPPPPFEGNGPREALQYLYYCIIFIIYY
jgi:hypothetical protein